nr:MAG TPA: hypothetical protein [Caudoviricetes sp.]
MLYESFITFTPLYIILSLYFIQDSINIYPT